MKEKYKLTLLLLAIAVLYSLFYFPFRYLRGTYWLGTYVVIFILIVRLLLKKIKKRWLLRIIFCFSFRTRGLSLLRIVRYYGARARGKDGMLCHAFHSFFSPAGNCFHKTILLNISNIKTKKL